MTNCQVGTPMGARLVTVREGMEFVGVQSRTTYYKLIRASELPPLIKRGRRSFHLESDLTAYVARLAAQRNEQPGST